MNTSGVKKHIKKGIKCDFDVIKQYIILSGILFLCSLIWFAVSDDIFVKIISVAMQIVTVVTYVIFLRISSGEYATIKRLKVNLLFPFYLATNLILFSLIFYIIEFGYGNMIYCIVLLPITVGTVLFIISLIKYGIISNLSPEKENRKDNKKSIVYKAAAGVGGIGAIGGLVGYNMSKIIFKDVKISSNMFFIVPFVAISCVLMCSVGNIVKLIYVKKLNKLGVGIDD